MEKDYWEKYYKLHNIPSEPSLFAKYVLDKHLAKNSSLLELGCGNGRDAIFFAINDIDVLAVDQCEEEISLLSQTNQHPNLKFKHADFTNLASQDLFDNIYSRFTLHSVSEEGENKTLQWVSGHLKAKGKFFIEARGQQNEFYRLGSPVEGEPNAYIYENHYRRFINFDELVEKLKVLGLQIILAEEKPGFAPYKGTDQIFIRIIAEKK